MPPLAVTVRLLRVMQRAFEARATRSADAEALAWESAATDVAALTAHLIQLDREETT